MRVPRPNRIRPVTGIPPCRAMGSQCDRLRVLLRVATLDRQSEAGSRDGRAAGGAGGAPSRRLADPASGDHEATWLLGHTERITFLGGLRRDGDDLFHEAVLHVRCKHLERGRREGRQRGGDGDEYCAAHGYSRQAPRHGGKPDPAEPRCLPGDRFRIVESGRTVTRRLAPPVRPPRELPIHAGSNPCVGAPCRTSDNTRGAACCRDLQIEIMCTPRQRRLEALVRSRQPPRLCKVDRVGPFSLGAELISACAFLMSDGIHCALHGRRRPDGRRAKPDLCSEWPEPGDNMHPGCVFRQRDAVGRRGGVQAGVRKSV